MECNLKVGGIIYSENYYNGVNKHKISRETATTYIVGDQEIKLDKPFVDGCYAKGNKSGWGYRTRYYMPNYDLLSKYQRRINNRTIENFAFNKLSNEDAQKVVDFLNKINQTKTT